MKCFRDNRTVNISLIIMKQYLKSHKVLAFVVSKPIFNKQVKYYMS